MNLPGSARLWRAMSLQHESLTPQPPGSYVSICYLTPPAKIYFTEHFNEWLSAYLFPYANIAEVWCWLYCQPKATKKVRSLKRLLPCVGRSSSLERPSRFLDGPWKRVKLTRWPVSLRLHVHIKHETLGVWRYEQHTFQEGGKDTLGELHHVLEDLKARHLAEAARQAQP